MAFDGTIQNFPEYGKSREQLLARARELKWYHTLELDPSFTTAGEFDLRDYVRNYLPTTASLKGRSVIDIGSSTGFWCFELEKLGARGVVASDIPDFVDTDFSILHGRDEHRPKTRSADGVFRESLRIAATLYGSTLRNMICSAYDLRPETAGSYDLVHCGSMLMHLFGPHLALQRMASICRDTMLITTETDPTNDGEPLLRFRGHVIPYVHFLPSPSCLGDMLACCGFERVLRGPTFHLCFRDAAANPMRIPHTTYIALKEGSVNMLQLPAPGPVADKDRAAEILADTVPAAAGAGSTITILVNVRNASGVMWHVNGGADEIRLAFDTALECGEDRIPVKIPPSPTCHFLPAGLSTLVSVKIQIPPWTGRLVLKPCVEQNGVRFRVNAPEISVPVVSDLAKTLRPSLLDRVRARITGG